MLNKFYGIDPSFAGLGVSKIDTDIKVVTFSELSVNVGEGTFTDVIQATSDMQKELSYMQIEGSLIGMEIPPTTGFYAVKLWSLDTKIYEFLKNCNNAVWLFNVSFLRFINGKNNSKKDTMEMIDKIVDIFKINDYTVVQELVGKTGKPKKLTSNQCDSFLYCIRMFIKYSLELGINGELVQDILNINEKFIEEKESLTGKSKKK